MVEIKASPTEYRGIVYRSKNEARFARMLDNCGLDYFYEPPVELENYIPDFFIFPDGYPEQDRGFLIELKPAMPTETYFQKLQRVISALEMQTLDISGRPASYFMCCWGSFYHNDDFRIALISPGNKKSWRESTVLFKSSSPEYREAKAYRFDLRERERSYGQA